MIGLNLNFNQTISIRSKWANTSELEVIVEMDEKENWPRLPQSPFSCMYLDWTSSIGYVHNCYRKKPQNLTQIKFYFFEQNVDIETEPKFIKNRSYDDDYDIMILDCLVPSKCFPCCVQ